VSKVVRGSRSFDPARPALIAATATATVLGLAGTFLGVLRLLSYGRAVIFQSIYPPRPTALRLCRNPHHRRQLRACPAFQKQASTTATVFLLLVSLVFVGNLLRLTGLGAVYSPSPGEGPLIHVRRVTWNVFKHE